MKKDDIAQARRTIEWVIEHLQCVGGKYKDVYIKEMEYVDQILGEEQEKKEEGQKKVHAEIEGGGWNWWYVCEECRTILPTGREKRCPGCGGVIIENEGRDTEADVADHKEERGIPGRNDPVLTGPAVEQKQVRRVQNAGQGEGAEAGADDGRNSDAVQSGSWGNASAVNDALRGMSMEEMIPQWIEADNLPSTTKFLCPYCREMVYFSHGSSLKARRRGLTKRCLYKFCPWCGEKVTPLRINYISD